MTAIILEYFGMEILNRPTTVAASENYDHPSLPGTMIEAHMQFNAQNIHEWKMYITVDII